MKMGMKTRGRLAIAVIKERKIGDSKMWRVKGCPRCGGDILIYTYHDVKHESCLQCGYHRELYKKPELGQQINNEEGVGSNV